MLTEDQYKKLNTQRDVLEHWRLSKTQIRNDYSFFVNLHNEITGTNECGTCGGVLIAIMNRLVDFIDEYEKQYGKM